MENGHLSLYREKAREEKESERSEGEKGEVAFSLRRFAAALLLSLFSLNIRDYSASLLGVTGRKSS